MIIYTITKGEEEVAGFNNQGQRNLCLDYLNFLDGKIYQGGEEEITNDE